MCLGRYIAKLFKKKQTNEVWLLSLDEYGDRKVSILDFDNKEFVLPIKAALSDITEIR